MGRLTLIDFFDKGARRTPDRDFIIDQRGARSYREVSVTTHRLANALKAADIAPGTRFAVYSPNSAEAFEAILGGLRAGCTWVSLNTRNSLQDNIRFISKNDVEVLFYAPSMSEHVAAMLAECPGLKLAVSLAEGTAEGPGWADFQAGQPDMSEPVDREPEDLAVVLASGGTTGEPKGVMLSHRAWQTMIFGLTDIYRCEHPVMLMVAPITHGAGTLALGMMNLGSTNVILPGFEAVSVFEAIQTHKVTHLFLPPTAIYMMLAHPDVGRYDYSSLTHFLSAASAISIEKMKEAIEVFGPVMCQMYGQSETLTTVTYHAPDDLARWAADPDMLHRLSSVGKECLVSRVAIMDDAGNILPRNQAGEIVVRSDSIFSGYHGREAESEETRAFGWHHTSDIGRIDDDGYLYVIDRKRDMIITGGFNVYSSEVEQVIWSHPAVQDCAVIGLPHEKWGEVISAAVQLKSGASLDAQELNLFCREHLPSMKVPKQIQFWDDLPRSAVGKVLKRSIRDMWVDEGAEADA